MWRWPCELRDVRGRLPCGQGLDPEWVLGGVDHDEAAAHRVVGALENDLLFALRARVEAVKLRVRGDSVFTFST